RHDLVIFGRACAGPLPEAFSKRFGSRLEQTAAIVGAGFRAMASAPVARRKPPPFAATEPRPGGFAEIFSAGPQDGLMMSLPIEAVERIFALGFALDQLRRHLRDLDRCVREAARRR